MERQTYDMPPQTRERGEGGTDGLGSRPMEEEVCSGGSRRGYKAEEQQEER